MHRPIERDGIDHLTVGAGIAPQRLDSNDSHVAFAEIEQGALAFVKDVLLTVSHTRIYPYANVPAFQITT